MQMNHKYLRRNARLKYWETNECKSSDFKGAMKAQLILLLIYQLENENNIIAYWLLCGSFWKGPEY